LNRLARLSFVSTARRLVLLVAMLLLFATALDVLWELTQPGGWYMLPRWVGLRNMSETFLVVYGFLSLLTPCVYLYLSMVQSRLEKGVVGKGTDGEDICLTPEAVERVIVRDVKRGVAEVTRVRRCTVSQGSRGARVLLNVAVAEGVSVPTARKRTRETVKATLERVIGYSDSTEVRVKVSDVARPDTIKRPRRKAPKSDRKEAIEHG
jgi:uncharacterized alkaline shock family protein YloU